MSGDEPSKSISVQEQAHPRPASCFTLRMKLYLQEFDNGNENRVQESLGKARRNR